MSFGLDATKKIEEASAVEAASDNTTLFMNQLRGVALDCINSDKKLFSIEGLDVERVCQFVSTLSQDGHAEIQGTDQECRSICVTAQGAIEDALTKMLLSEEVKSVKAVFLTPLPTTPLRKKGVTEGLTNIPFDEARQYTLDMRENTLRTLRDAGGSIVAAYSIESFQELHAQTDEGSLKQVAVWEEESKHDRVIDVPLATKVPGELVGALYLITDREGNKFYLPTQGIQAKDAPEGEAIWKKWLTLSEAENEGVSRSSNMLEHIEKFGNEKIVF